MLSGGYFCFFYFVHLKLCFCSQRRDGQKDNDLQALNFCFVYFAISWTPTTTTTHSASQTGCGMVLAARYKVVNGEGQSEIRNLGKRKK